MSAPLLHTELASYLDEPPLERDVDLAKVGRYRGFGEIVRAVLALRQHGARVSIAARSRRGVPILRVELGPASATRTSLSIAGIHAMEWIGVEAGLEILERIAGSATDRRVVAFPLLNPDGYRDAERDLRASKKLRFVRANGAGVDLNRNWPTHWRGVRPVARFLPFLGSSGSAPGSEPEVDAVLRAIDEAKHEGRPFERAISLHSFGNKLLLPYGGRWALPAEYPRLRAVADAVRERLQSRYTVTTSARWVPGSFAYGMELDHLLHEGAEPLLVECSQGGLALSDPSSWLVPFRWFNPRDPRSHAAELADALVPFLDDDSTSTTD